MSPLTTDSELQIGIEIEFVAPHNVEWEDEHLPDLDHWNHVSLSKDACFHRLAVALHDAGLPACYQMKTAPLRCERNPLREAAPPAVPRPERRLPSPRGPDSFPQPPPQRQRRPRVLV